MIWLVDHPRTYRILMGVPVNDQWLKFAVFYHGHLSEVDAKRAAIVEFPEAFIHEAMLVSASA